MNYHRMCLENEAFFFFFYINHVLGIKKMNLTSCEFLCIVPYILQISLVLPLQRSQINSSTKSYSV